MMLSIVNLHTVSQIIKIKQSERDLVRLNCDILEAWKQNCNTNNVRPTLRDIGRAFGNNIPQYPW
jgi:hypothetical protein